MSSLSQATRAVAAAANARNDLERADRVLRAALVGREGLRRSHLYYEYLMARAFGRHALGVAASRPNVRETAAFAVAMKALDRIREREEQGRASHALGSDLLLGLLAEQFLERSEDLAIEPLIRLGRSGRLVNELFVSDNEQIDIGTAVIQRLSMTLVWHEAMSLEERAPGGAGAGDEMNARGLMGIAADRVRGQDADIDHVVQSDVVQTIRSEIVRRYFHEHPGTWHDSGPFLTPPQLPWGGESRDGLMF